MEVDGASSLPSDYVTILHLKERWLKQQQQSTSKPNPPTIKPKPNDDSPSPPASKTLNDVVVPPPKPDSVSKTHNDVVPVKKYPHHQSINKPKVDVTSSSHDNSASNTLNVVSVRKTPYRVNNKPKPEDGSASSKNPPDDVIPRQAVNKIKPGDDSASSKTQTPNDVVRRQAIDEVKPDVVKTQDGSASKVVRRKKKPYRAKNKPEPEVGMHDSGSKTVVESVDKNDEKHEEEGDKTEESKSKQPATKKKSTKSRNPRLIVNQILMEQKNEHVKEKKQEQRPEEVWEPKGEKETFSGNVSVDVGETVRNVAAAGVKEMNVGQRSKGGGGRGYRGFNSGPRKGASFGVQKGQMNMNMNKCVWVKKGESLST